MGTTRTSEPAGAGAGGAQEAVGRLMRAAGRSGAHLIGEAASLIDGWAVLADPIAGAVYSTPAAAAAQGVHAAAHPQDHPSCVAHPAAGAVLVLSPGLKVPGSRTELVTATTAALLEVRAQRAAELRAEQMRLHATLIRLLLSGHTAAVTDMLGGDGLTHATVYRLAGPDVPTAHQVLWRAANASLAPGRPAYALMGEVEDELVVADLHGGADDGRLLRLVSRVGERHSMLAGLAGPLPLPDLPTAYADAFVARHSASPSRRVVPAEAVGTTGLARLLPTQPYVSWAAAVLAPVASEHRRLLLIWLRTASVSCTAATLGLSAGTVRARLRGLAGLLGADLDDATVRAHLLLSLRAPAPAAGLEVPGPAGPGSLRNLPEGILDSEAAKAWAAGLVAGLEPRLRIALACWLRHHARTAPAASELHVHRTTLTVWLAEAAEQLGQHLDDAITRAELHLALEATAPAGHGDDPARLPRRGGRTYKGHGPSATSVPSHARQYD
ncbi:helix-turn-helix domain-containing protein [Streptomyces sp. NPDC053720]|uniref:helix-turn-helix domain-containing protein n=1 Tax=Streptomyces sp. NPDC053720 TaxID=3154855 RepID=UPI00343EA9B7